MTILETGYTFALSRFGNGQWSAGNIPGPDGENIFQVQFFCGAEGVMQLLYTGESYIYQALLPPVDPQSCSPPLFYFFGTVQTAAGPKDLYLQIYYAP